MIDREDFPQLTPEQHLAEAERLMQLPNMAAVEEEGRKGLERIERLFQKYIVARKNLNLKAMGLEPLLDRFEEICLMEDEAHNDPLEEGIRKYNECQDALMTVHEELKSRGPDTRRALMRFYNHSNHQVRLKAAKLSYHVAPGPARRVLEELQKMRLPDVSLEAGMTLYAVDNGTSTLD